MSDECVLSINIAGKNYVRGCLEISKGFTYINDFDQASWEEKVHNISSEGLREQTGLFFENFIRFRKREHLPEEGAVVTIPVILSGESDNSSTEVPTSLTELSHLPLAFYMVMSNPHAKFSPMCMQFLGTSKALPPDHTLLLPTQKHVIVATQPRFWVPGRLFDEVFISMQVQISNSKTNTTMGTEITVTKK